MTDPGSTPPTTSTAPNYTTQPTSTSTPPRNTTKVQKSPLHGTGTFAARPITAGSIIFTEDRPLAWTLEKPHRYDYCAWCAKPSRDENVLLAGEEAAEVKKCAGCLCVGFCSKECQTAAWTRHHKHECKILAKACEKGTRQLPTTTFLLLSIHLLFKAFALGKLSAGVTSDLEKIQNLTHNVQAVRREAEKAQKLHVWEAMCYGTLDFSDWGKSKAGWTLVQENFARLSMNGLHVLRPSFDSIGTAIYDKISRVNHSCDPNIVVTFQGPKLIVHALKDIAQDAELVWSYIDDNMPLYKRQEQLQRQYCFKCACSRCKNGLADRADADWVPGSTLPDMTLVSMRGLDPEDIGENEQPDGSCYLPPGSRREDLHREQVLRADLAGMLDFYERLALRLPQAHPLDVGDPEDPTFSATDLHLIVCGLDFAARARVFPPTRHPYCELRASFVRACLSVPYFATAFRYQLAQYFLIDPVLYPVTWHPLRVVSKWKLVHIALNVAELDVQVEIARLNATGSLRDTLEVRSLKVLQSHAAELDYAVIVYGLLLETADNVVLSHGPDSSFARLVRGKFEEVLSDMREARGQAEVDKLRGKIEGQWGALRRVAEGVHDEALRTVAGSLEMPDDARPVRPGRGGRRGRGWR